MVMEVTLDDIWSVPVGLGLVGAVGGLEGRTDTAGFHGIDVVNYCEWVVVGADDCDAHWR